MTAASTIVIPVLWALLIAGIGVGGALILRRKFRRDDQVIVPAYTLVDRYPLPAPVAHGTADIGIAPRRHRTAEVKAVTAVPGYGRHSFANAVGCDSQRAPEENTGALGWREMAALLEVRS